MILKTIRIIVFVVSVLSQPYMAWLLSNTELLSSRSDNTSSLKYCRFREQVLLVDVFPFYTGYNCLNYNDPRVFVGEESPAFIACILPDLNVRYPCYQKENYTLPFDPTNTEAYQVLSAKFKKISNAERWRRCYQASLQCCNKIVTASVAQPDASRCPELWDGWDCWDSAAENTFETAICKEYIYSADSAPSCHYYSRKHCFSRSLNSSTAHWNQTTDYTSCSTVSRLITKYTFHVAMLGVSIVLSFPAVIIFFCYRRLRIPRIALHRNLLIVIIIRSALSILQIDILSFNSLLTTDEMSRMDGNGVGCRLLSSLTQVFSNAVFAMMLVEGIFLHRLIAAVFKSQPNMIFLYSSAAAISILPMIPWTVLRIVKYDNSCWATGAAELDWINNGTRVFLLVINFLLMLDIIRVLLTKLRGVNSRHSDKVKRTARSTLFLIPLFGVNTLFVADKPSVIPSCDWETVFDMVAHTMEGLQGPCVALLYCYLNKEVQMYLKKTISNTFPKMEALHKRRSTQFGRRTFTTNVNDDPLEEEELPGPPSSLMVDGATLNGKLSHGVDVPERRRTTLGTIGEAKESLENSLAEEVHKSTLESPSAARSVRQKFDAWNRIGDSDLPPEDSARKVGSWNISPNPESGSEAHLKTSDTSSLGVRSEPEYEDSSNSNNSSSLIFRGSDSDVGHPTGRISVNLAPDRQNNSDKAQEHQDDNSNYYSALVFPPGSNTSKQHRNDTNNSVEDGHISDSRC